MNPQPWTIHLSERCDYCEHITKKDVIVEERLLKTPGMGPGYSLICGSCGRSRVISWSRFEKRK